MIKPKRLKPGDKVAIVSPSGGAASLFPLSMQGGIDILRNEFSLDIEEYPTTKMSRNELWQNPKSRADDINRAFADKSIRGIITSIGGSDSVRILKYLDIDLIMKNPKLIMGYSDSTSFLSFLNMHGLVTYYGPSVMAGFAYLKNFPEALKENKDFLFSSEEYQLKAFPNWAEDYAGWESVADIGNLKSINNTFTKHRWLNKGENTTGGVWGGCVEILEMMVGTFAWPKLDFFEGKVIFLETSEEKPTPDHVAYVLRNWGLQGILDRINGIIFAKPKSYSEAEKLELEENVKMIIIEEWGRQDMNIIMNMDIGHTEPRHIIPYGIQIEIDSEKEIIRFVESAFES